MPETTIGRTAHLDTFAGDRLPPRSEWPVIDLSGVPELDYPPRFNIASELLDRRVAAGGGDAPAIYFEGRVLTYRQLFEDANKIARVLTEDVGLVSGNRVLLRGANNPRMAACWFGVLKAGGVVVATMPQLRARELRYVLDKARIDVALCDGRLVDELDNAIGGNGRAPVPLIPFNADGPESLEGRMAGKRADWDNVDTAAEDVALIAFTSGTTGQPKGAMHLHQDILASCDTYSRYVLAPGPSDVFCGTPPLAFTFGLGQLVYPMHAGGSVALLERPSPEGLLQLIQDSRATICFTAPTMYRALIDLLPKYDISSLKKCVSAGETLPLPTFEAWRAATGLEIMDGIGSTEMFHIFIGSPLGEIRPGATGRAVPGYRARVVDDELNELSPGTIGRLAVQGPTGCKYLDDPERQRVYVQAGWNLTGDAYTMDEDGYFWFQARADDMIISAGYNIAGPEVEAVLLDHPKVRECGVVAAPDPGRGFIVKAYIVLRDRADAHAAMVEELQAWVKSQIAPYKYPRAIEFVESLPRTETGKLQRFKLRAIASESAGRA